MPEPTRRMVVTLLGGLLIVVGMVYFWQATAGFRSGAGDAATLRGMTIGGILLTVGTVLMFRATGRRRE